MTNPLLYHDIEYLNSSLAENSITGEPLVIITIRPDEGSCATLKSSNGCGKY